MPRPHRSRITDPNNKITETEYDSLGRLTKVWLPNRSRALSKTPNYVYDYKVTSAAMSWVSTSTLKGDGSGYNTSYTFYDSLLRTRQIQSPTPQGGRLISMPLYDTRGLAVSQQSEKHGAASLGIGGDLHAHVEATSEDLVVQMITAPTAPTP